MGARRLQPGNQQSPQGPLQARAAVALQRGGGSMNRHVNSISGRLSLRPPQRESLEILDRIVEIARPSKDLDPTAALAAIRSEYPSVADFERDFPSVCFAL